MLIKYRTGVKNLKPIEAIECDWENHERIRTVEGASHCKKGRNVQFHDTWGEAKEFLVGEAKADVALLTQQLDEAESQLADMVMMRKRPQGKRA